MAGFSYDYTLRRLTEAAPIPEWRRDPERRSIFPICVLKNGIFTRRTNSESAGPSLSLLAPALNMSNGHFAERMSLAAIRTAFIEGAGGSVGVDRDDRNFGGIL